MLINGELAAAPLSIGALAAEAGVSVDTVRCYERKGLLPPPVRTSGAHRRYGPDTVARLRLVQVGRQLNLRLTEIQKLLAIFDTTSEVPVEAIQRLLIFHIERVDQELGRLSRLRTELAAALAGVARGDCPADVAAHIQAISDVPVGEAAA